MGEQIKDVVMSEEEREKMELNPAEDKRGKERLLSRSSEEIITWLPRMVLTVLLVEADDSTRQIITALLRKCGYRVAAVSDGLKAWETLKVKAHSIDLIITEVELPSISGYALLTLIMEHDICKNIPVIMMSYQDSISLVLKCMLKGAADFLIKPVRKNKLRNLWQHVWRRQTKLSWHTPQGTAAAQDKVDNSENNIISSPSSDLASTRVKGECSERGSDVKSSSTAPYLEAESVYLKNSQGLSYLEHETAPVLSNGERNEECEDLVDVPIMLKSETKSFATKSRPDISFSSEACNTDVLDKRKKDVSDEMVTSNAGCCQGNNRKNDNMTSEVDCQVKESGEVSNEAIDLIGRFENLPEPIDQLCSNNDGRDEFNAPLLELSLKGSYSSTFNSGARERHTLNHSIASAFSRYDCGKVMQSLHPPTSSRCVIPESAVASNKELSNQLFENSTGSSLWYMATSSNSHDKKMKMVTQHGISEASSPVSQPGSVPVSGTGFKSLYTNYDRLVQPMFYSQASFHTKWNSISNGPKEQPSFPSCSSECHESEVYNSNQLGHPLSESVLPSPEKSTQDVESLESREPFTHASSSTALSTNDSLCNGQLSKLNSNQSETTEEAVTQANASGRLNDNHALFQNGSKGVESHCLTQREAALQKFRLKRKDRCFEKKVRYQSRKRLAEQRPRVKGQFVRQVQTEPPADQGKCS